MSGQDDFKDKREKHSVQIRRANREEILMKRRNMDIVPQTMEENQTKPILIVDPRYSQEIEKLINLEYPDTMFEQLVACMNSADVLEQHRGVIGMRKLLAQTYEPPINKFIDRGLTNKCLWMAKQKQFPQIKLEASWILTNVASGQSKFCEKLVERGGIELFIGILQENEKGIVDQAIWGIGNLAADNSKYRDAILKKGGLEALIKIIENTKNKLIIRNGAWAVTNLCRGHPLPDYKFIKQACPLLCKVIKTGALNDSNSKEILSDVIWAISYMTEGSKSRIERVNKAEIMNEIFQFVMDPFKNIYIPALKIVGNFSNGNENHTDEIIKHGIFDLALKVLDHPKNSMRREMCWILSNIAAGVSSQVEQFMSRTDLLTKIAQLFYRDLIEIKREICWIYGNFGHMGDRKKVIQIIFHFDVLRIFVNMLQETDSETLENVLETLFKIFFVGKKCEINNRNVLLDKFLEYGGAVHLESLQMHENRGVYERVTKILTKFFELQENLI